MNTKNFLKSLTMQGAALTTAGVSGLGQPIAMVANLVGIPIEPAEVADSIDAVMTVVGILATVVGRVRAKQPLSLM